MDRGLSGLHRIKLIVDGGCGTGEVIDFLNLHIKRKTDIMP
jgi:hypothetical protein